jgi:uncharacterized protein YgiM (DUF1202 family)
MKTNHRWILTATLFAGLVARPALADKQLDTNAPAIIPPSTTIAPAPAPDIMATNTPAPSKPAKKHTKKHITKAKTAHKKAAAPEISVPLTPGPATVSARHVNVRGKPTIYSEVLAHLTNGEPVTVIEEITRENPKADDPNIWAKIVLPGTANLWVSAQFVDTNKTVTVKKLNLRTGPGENYSVAGTLNKGDVINDIGGTNGWIEIQPTTNAYAFVAAAYLKQETAAPAETNAAPAEIIPPVPPTQTSVAEAGQVAPPPAEAPANTTMPPASAIPITTDTNNTDVGTVQPEATNAPAEVEPPQPRIVEREGIVRRTFSIIAPSTFELVNPDTGRTVNYLYTNSKELDLTRYKGLHIIVTGEESLDERWQNTPVITIQKIQVLD